VKGTCPNPNLILDSPSPACEAKFASHDHGRRQVCAIANHVFRHSADANTFGRPSSNEANFASLAGDGESKIKIMSVPQILLLKSVCADDESWPQIIHAGGMQDQATTRNHNPVFSRR
jgi:hypothetical protein